MSHLLIPSAIPQPSVWQLLCLLTAKIMPGNIAVLILAFNMMAVCVCDCIPKCSSDLRGLQMFKLTMKIKYFPYQKLAFLMNCSGVSKGDMEILAFSGFCLVFTPLFLPAPLSPAPPLPGCLSSLQPLASPPASHFLLRGGGKPGEGDVLAPTPSWSTISLHCTTVVQALQACTTAFLQTRGQQDCPALTAVQAGDKEKEQCPHATFPCQHPGLLCQLCGQNLSPSEGKRRLERYHF